VRCTLAEWAQTTYRLSQRRAARWRRVCQPGDGRVGYAHDVRFDFIRPGKPLENAFLESFNGKLRDECLNSPVFASVAEAQVVLDAWRHDYNAVRPHSALPDRTPAATASPTTPRGVPAAAASTARRRRHRAFSTVNGGRARETDVFEGIRR
jgi:transposase InsO family protein